MKENRLVLFGISLASFLGLLDLTIVNTALPARQQEFHSSVLQLQWVINSVLLILTTSMAILAKLADTYGRRLFLYLGLLIFGVSSIGVGLALGPAVGGILVSTIGWRWIFWINPPLALICWLCGFKALKESKSAQPEPMDWRGSGFMIN